MSRYLYKTLAEFDQAYRWMSGDFRETKLICDRQSEIIDDLKKQLAWHRAMHEKLIDTMNAGARESKFPRN